MIASVLLSLGSISGIGLFLVALFVITWGYAAFCEAVFNGQTLGKRMVGIRVVSDRGIPITGAQAVLRSLVGTIDGPIPFCYLLGLASMLCTRKFQRLGDLAAGTMVVVEARRGRAGVIQVELSSARRSCPGCRSGWRPARSWRGRSRTTYSVAAGSAGPPRGDGRAPGRAAPRSLRAPRRLPGRRGPVCLVSPRLPGRVTYHAGRRSAVEARGVVARARCAAGPAGRASGGAASAPARWSGSASSTAPPAPT
jgi:hypothetical protein